MGPRSTEARRDLARVRNLGFLPRMLGRCGRLLSRGGIGLELYFRKIPCSRFGGGGGEAGGQEAGDETGARNWGLGGRGYGCGEGPG